MIQDPLALIGDNLFLVNWTRINEIYMGEESGDPLIPGFTLIEFVAPVAFEGTKGVHCLLEYLDDDAAMAIGRESWGWPKKMGDFTWEQRSDGFSFSVSRRGDLLAETEFRFDPSATASTEWPQSYEMGDETPNLQVRDRSNRNGRTERDIINDPVVMDWSKDLGKGAGTLALHDGPQDALSVLGPVKVLAAEASESESRQPAGTIMKTFDL